MSCQRDQNTLRLITSAVTLREKITTDPQTDRSPFSLHSEIHSKILFRSCLRSSGAVLTDPAFLYWKPESLLNHFRNLPLHCGTLNASLGQDFWERELKMSHNKVTPSFSPFFPSPISSLILSISVLSAWHVLIKPYKLCLQSITASRKDVNWFFFTFCLNFLLFFFTSL